MIHEHRNLAADTEGSTFVEYLIVLTTVSLLGSFAIVMVGVPFLHTFRYAQFVLTLPIP